MRVVVKIVKAAFFDLFFTLVTPDYTSSVNEYDVLGISKDIWEFYAENETLYRERALGEIKDKNKIIDRIVALMPFQVTGQQRNEIFVLRQSRMKRALTSVDNDIIHTLILLRNKGIKLCLISNADKIDCEYWNISPLANIFEKAIFSCDIGILKPNKEIYEYAMKQLGVKPNESIFVGDGGSEELKGAKRAGMQAVFTEYLDKKEAAEAKRLRSDSDYHIDNFDQLLSIID
jgi:putative hydrolase of the HAD superfamily